ncbi:TrmH family RNA methyltransferase [Fontivita pretiosa]|uniref:TrmH family RNA methyltransferase n=1 Tax=Fontivita pretiosa TaxID=2989684 RepID=UPI003D182C67
MTRPCRIDSLDDPRIVHYRNLKDRELAREHGGRFIAEGEHVVRRLLTSDYPVESVLLAARRAEEIAPIVPESVPVYVVPDAMMQQILGFRFHSGVIACGRRKPLPTLDEAMSRMGTCATIVVCPEINNTENLGGLMRIAAAFGADALILGPRSCDPFYRQAIRVSMGAVFSLNIARSGDLIADLRALKERYNVQRVATVLDEQAEDLAGIRLRPPRIAVLFGNEAQGLPPELLAECDRKITIPMKLGTDSLNVMVAAGVILHHLTRMCQVEPAPQPGRCAAGTSGPPANDARS